MRPPITPKERKLFWIRLSSLFLFAILGLLLGYFTREYHVTIAVVGLKFFDSVGEALSEALAAGIEEA